MTTNRGVINHEEFNLDVFYDLQERWKHIDWYGGWFIWEILDFVNLT
jgi:hypothetical protein